MNLNELIAFYESKLENPDLTPGSRKVASATLHHLTMMQTEIEIQRDALESLRAENTKLYADLCEMGDMARERSRRKPEIVEAPETQSFYTDRQEVFMTYRGNELLRKAFVDKLIRHKWPEEKPKEGWYLVWTTDYECVVAFYNQLGQWRIPFYSEPMTSVKHWWNLPEVRE